MSHTGSRKPRTSPLLEVGEIPSEGVAIKALTAAISSQDYFRGDVEIIDLGGQVSVSRTDQHLILKETIESTRGTLGQFAQEILQHEGDEEMRFPLSETESTFLLIFCLQHITGRLEQNHPKKEVFSRNSVFLANLASKLYESAVENPAGGSTPQRLNVLMYTSTVITEPNFRYKENLPLFELYLRNKARMLMLIPGVGIADKWFKRKKVKA